MQKLVDSKNEETPKEIIEKSIGITQPVILKEKTETKKPSNNGWIIVIVIVLVLTLAVVMYINYKNSQDGNNGATK